MCNRLHYKDAGAANDTAALLRMRGYHVSVLRSGCVFEDGAILELGDSAYEFAIQISNAFRLDVRIEM